MTRNLFSIASAIILLGILTAHAGPSTTISGTVYLDPSHPGQVVSIGLPPVSGWPVALCQGDDCQDTQTGSAGDFSFPDLANGEYVVSVPLGNGETHSVALAIGEAGIPSPVLVSVAGWRWRVMLPMVGR